MTFFRQRIFIHLNYSFRKIFSLLFGNLLRFAGVPCLKIYIRTKLISMFHSLLELRDLSRLDLFVGYFYAALRVQGVRPIPFCIRGPQQFLTDNELTVLRGVQYQIFFLIFTRVVAAFLISLNFSFRIMDLFIRLVFYCYFHTYQFRNLWLICFV